MEERLPGYLGKIKSIGKETLVKTENNPQANTEIDALLTKSWITKHPEPILKTCQNQEWHITNERLFENAFEIAAKNKFQQYCRSTLKLSSKINVYLCG